MIEQTNKESLSFVKKTLAQYKADKIITTSPVDMWFAKRPTVWSDIVREVADNERPSPKLIWDYLVEVHEYPFSDGTIDDRVAKLRKQKNSL